MVVIVLEFYESPAALILFFNIFGLFLPSFSSSQVLNKHKCLSSWFVFSLNYFPWRECLSRSLPRGDTLTRLKASHTNSVCIFFSFVCAVFCFFFNLISTRQVVQPFNAFFSWRASTYCVIDGGKETTREFSAQNHQWKAEKSAQ